MGLNIQIKDAVFTKTIDLLVPLSASLIGYWNFNSTRDEAIKNKVTGAAGTLVGNPIVLGAKIATDKANGFITDVSKAGEKTLIVVSKITGNAAPLSSINYDRSPAQISPTGIASFSNQVFMQLNGTGVPKTPTTMDMSKVHFMAASYGASINDLYVSAGGILVNTQATHIGDLTNNDKFRIGGWGVVSTALIGSTETYAALIYNKKLSASEVRDVFDYLKKQLSTIIID